MLIARFTKTIVWMDIHNLEEDMTMAIFKNVGPFNQRRVDLHIYGYSKLRKAEDSWLEYHYAKQWEEKIISSEDLATLLGFTDEQRAALMA